VILKLGCQSLDKKESNMSDAKDEIEDAQIINMVNAIRLQITSTTSFAELQRLGIVASGLSSNNPAIMQMVANLQSTIAKREEVAQDKLLSNVVESDIKEKEASLSEQQEKQILQQYKEHIENKKANIIEIHTRFNINIDKSIKRLQQGNFALESIIKDSKDGNPINEKSLDAVLLSDVEVKELRRIYTEYNEINQQHKEAHAEEKRLKKEISEIDEKLQNPELSVREKRESQSKLSISKEKLKEHGSFVEIINGVKAKSDVEIDKKEKYLKIRGIVIDKLGEIVTEQYEQEPEKDKGLREKHMLLEEQYLNEKEMIKQAKLGNLNTQKKPRSTELIAQNVKNNLVKSSKRNNNSSVSPPHTPDVSNRGGRVGHGGI
jgi:hypothetical protein